MSNKTAKVHVQVSSLLPPGCSITLTYHWANVSFSPFHPLKRLLPFSLPHQSLTEVNNLSYVPKANISITYFCNKYFVNFVVDGFQYLATISVKKFVHYDKNDVYGDSEMSGGHSVTWLSCDRNDSSYHTKQLSERSYVSCKQVKLKQKLLVAYYIIHT